MKILSIHVLRRQTYHNFVPVSRFKNYAGTLIDFCFKVPAGDFAANGTQVIPEKYASQIPNIAFSVPDISATATLRLQSTDSNTDVACIDAEVTNGKTANSPALSFVAAGIAGAAFVMTGLGAVSTISGGAAASGGSASTGGGFSPSFLEVFGWFQGIAMNGMMSVNYPPVYRSFTKNFAFSTGIIPWTSMQVSIDRFRQMTGGNLTENSVAYLKNSKVHTEGTAKISRRAYHAAITIRDSLSASTNATTDESLNAVPHIAQIETTVNGIKAYVEKLSVPEANTFLTVLLVIACAIATIVVGILLCKVILETWALFGSFPKSLTGFRKHYWSTMARSIVQLILVLYGVLVLYCIFQFTNGDSWAAKTLAALSLTVFTGVLAYFTFKIWRTAKKLEALEGDASGLYQDKKNWLKYSMFYDNYSKDYWWMFLPMIIYMFAKGCILAAGNGHGLGQTIAQFMIECLSKYLNYSFWLILILCTVLCLLIWNRPYERRSGNVINIFIQVVRALSVACIIVFVKELGISQTTQTVAGVVLIAVQSVLTAALAILIATNAFIAWCKQNPHRKRRKQAGMNYKDFENYLHHESKAKLSTDMSLSSYQTTSNFDYKSLEGEKTGSTNYTTNETLNSDISSTQMRHIPQITQPLSPHSTEHRQETQDKFVEHRLGEPCPMPSGSYRGVAW